MAAGGAAGDKVSQGPLSGQGTHRAARHVAVNKGEVQPVDTGRADASLQAVEREPRVSPDGFVLEAAPHQATPHSSSTHKVSFTNNFKDVNFLTSNK